MDEKTQKIYVGGRDYINEIDAKNQTLLRTIPLKDPRPQITSVQNLAVDSASDRAFVVVFDHDDRSGTKDGLYILTYATVNSLAMCTQEPELTR